ncbi:MAG: selenide,water dikinase, partial [Paraglaciecola sp.]
MNESDLVFIGGGHTHVLVLRMLAMNPIPNVRLTLISDTRLTPYSG